MPKRPNILLIICDQLRGDSLGYAGHPDVKTPYLDSLRAKGADFPHAHSSCPSCIAARAALHTGLSQERHGRTGYQDNVRWDYPTTLAGELTKAGYQTQCVGKMHVHPMRKNLGFESVLLHDGYLHAYRGEDVSWQESQREADDYFHHLREVLGSSADTTDSGLECNSWVAGPWPYSEKLHPTNWVTDNCLDFLRRRDTDRPFFLMASYLKPHPPLDPPQWYFDQYLRRDLRAPAVGSWEDTDELEKYGRVYDSKTGPSDPVLVHEMQAAYYALITHLDHQIGRIAQALVERHLMDNTLILFTSDHGEELGDHHMFRKSRPYEGSSRIPMMLSNLQAVGLGDMAGSTCSTIAELRDVLPTLLDAAGAEIPVADGVSLLGELRKPGRSLREALHGEHSYGDHSNHWIVTDHDKFIWHSQSGREQYFDLEQDPRELEDLINDSSKQARISELRSFLVKELQDRPEGFVEDGKLVSGRPYPPLVPGVLPEAGE